MKPLILLTILTLHVNCHNLITHCDKIYSLACFKLDAANWLDRFGINPEFSVIPGVTFVQNPGNVKVLSNELEEEVAREFPDDESAQADQFLIRKLRSFLSDHTVKLNLYSLFYEGDSEARKDKKGGENGGVMIAVGAMIMGLLLALAMGGLTALAGKALLTGLVSLVLATIIGLKELTSGKTYVSQPVPVLHEGWEQFAQRRGEIVREQ
ncbi:uncharacterized protein LOC126741921 [Anthonomus grandis grandis]|uniref:uncharacterized protein LOC126741921 n=1 Tax=Anthonomus grandis grandis TaxID=2921223 RepID=UPI002166145A|nr:uncharacterized protein LOC126741921 [Anthonomus grandis grandis]